MYTENNLKNRFFDKEAPEHFDSERATIAGGKARVRIKMLR